MKAVADVAHAHGLPVHVDGARIFNAAVALEMPAHELCKDVDDVGFCLSKGLSAPVGSMLCGSSDFIEEARRWRKILGGSMRQAGVIAAAGVVAVETMIDRMAEDHAHARRLAEGLSHIPGINVDPDDFQTNIVFVEVNPSTGTTEEFTDRMKEEGVLTAYRGGGRFRLVTHRQVSAEDVDTAVDRIAKVASEMRNAG
jgi:threonine aldolase